VFVLFKLLGNKRLVFLMLGFVFFMALMGFTLGQREQMTWPEKFLQDSVSFMQSLLYKPAGYIAGFFEDVGNLHIVYEENQVLKRTLSQYARDTAKLNELKAQNERLTAALEFTERQKRLNRYRWRIAEVVGVSPDPFNNTIKINLGEKDGIQENWAVVSVDGLIGRVVRVSPFYSNVQLITDINVRVNNTKAIAATVAGKESESFGMIESYELPGKDLVEKYRLPRGQRYLIMSKIQSADPLQIGDTIVTSGLGGVFPRGIEIGTVVSREVGDFGITHTAMVKPSSQFRNLREVFVVEVPGQ
jgi:rod shape-determining protein MreC